VISTSRDNRCKLAGVQQRLFHDLRRTAVRERLRSGVHESTARKISGHKTASMLQRYNIQSESDIREAMQLREMRIATQQQENGWSFHWPRNRFSKAPPATQ
jgi:integrase